MMGLIIKPILTEKQTLITEKRPIVSAEIGTEK